MHSSTSALDIANSSLLQSPIYWHHGWNNLQNSANTRIVLRPRWCKYTSRCSSPPCHHRPSQNLKIKPSHWKPNRGRNITSKDPKVAIKRPSWLTSEDPNTRLGSGELVPVPRTNCEMLDWSTHGFSYTTSHYNSVSCEVLNVEQPNTSHQEHLNTDNKSAGNLNIYQWQLMVVIIILKMIPFGKKWLHYHYHCTGYPLVTCSVDVAAAGGRLGPATSSISRHWAGTWYTGAGVVSGHYHLTEHNTQYSERVPILALSHLRIYFLEHAIYLVAPSLNIGLVSTWWL